jgi:hypothetical protein
MEKEMNTEINKLEKWLIKNKLKINISKTKAMMLCNKTNRLKYKKEIHNIKLEIEGEKVEFVEQFKYLGIIIDNEINLKAHASYTIRKLASKIGLFRRNNKCLPIQSKIDLYQAIVAPHIDYCSSILFLLNKNEIDKIQKLQNRAMRSILRVNKFTCIQLMSETLSWLNVKQRIVLNTLTLIYKICKGIAPSYLTVNMKPNNNVHNHHTRSNKDIYIERSKSKFKENSIYHKGIRIFNRIPIEIREAESAKSFRRNCCKYIKEGKLVTKKHEKAQYWDKLYD